MTLKASDLPNDVKRQLLDGIQQRIGYSNFDSLVGQLGEDGLIDAMFQHAATQQASPPKPTRTVEAMQTTWGLVVGSTPGAALGPVWGSILGIVWWLVMIGPIGFLIAVPVVFIVVRIIFAVGDMLDEKQRNFALTFTAITAAVAAAGVFAWFAGPWLVSGVGNWWSWLGGHF